MLRWRARRSSSVQVRVAGRGGSTGAGGCAGVGRLRRGAEHFFVDSLSDPLEDPVGFRILDLGEEFEQRAVVAGDVPVERRTTDDEDESFAIANSWGPCDLGPSVPSGLTIIGRIVDDCML